MKIVYASNGQPVGDGVRITRVSDNGQTLAVMVDAKTQRFAEIKIKDTDMHMGLGLGITQTTTSATTPGPENTVAPAITGTPEIGETLSLSTGTWSGTGVITYARKWYRDGAEIAGQTGATYVLVGADDLKTVFGRVTATDDLGARSAASAGVAVTYPTPTFSVQPSIDPASGPTSTVFTLDEGTAANTTLSIEYFRLDGADATADLYGLTYTAATEGTLTYKVRATNSGGFVLSNEISVIVSDVVLPTLDVTNTGDNFTATASDEGTAYYYVDASATPVAGATIQTTVAGATPDVYGSSAITAGANVISPNWAGLAAGDYYLHITLKVGTEYSVDEAVAFTYAVPTVSAADFALYINASDLTSTFQEITGASATTPADAATEPVGTIVNNGSAGGYWVAGTTGKRPLLGGSGGVFYTESDGTDDGLVISGLSLDFSAGVHIFAVVEELSGMGDFTGFWSFAGTGTGENGRNSGGLDNRDGSSKLNITLGRYSPANGVEVTQSGSGLQAKALIEGFIKNDLSGGLVVDGVSGGTDTASENLNVAVGRFSVHCKLDAAGETSFGKTRLWALGVYVGELSGTALTDVRDHFNTIAGL